MRVATDDGVELAVVDVGSGPPLLLVHGFGGAKEDFGDHFEALGRQARIAAFDHRGHGASDKPDDPAAYSLDRLAADTLAVADTLGLETFRLLGHSMGGAVARRVVLREPDRVDAVVFMNTAAGPPPRLDPDLMRASAALAVEPGGMDALRQRLDESEPLGSPAHARLLRERPGYREFGLRKWRALSPVMWATLVVEFVDQPDELSRMGAVRCPTLVVVGEQDETFLEPSRAIADAIAGARLVEIPDAGHSPQFENPGAWFAALDAFLHA